MLHRIFNQRLNQERRNHQVFYLGFNIQFNTHAIFAETRHLKREIAHGLLDLARQRNQIRRIVQRTAVEHRELTQQNARFVGISAHERRDSINSVEQKMRVNLALQRFQLHAGGKLLLAFQRLCRKLCGNKLGKAFRNGLLRGRNLARRMEEERQRAFYALAHAQRHNNCGLHAIKRLLKANLIVAEQRARLTVFGRCRNRGGENGIARLIAGMAQAFVTQNRFLIGNANGHGIGIGKEKRAQLLRRLLIQAAFQACQRLAGKLEHITRLTCANGIRVCHAAHNQH